MANGRDVINNLINTLSKINVQLEQVNDVLKKIEDNEIVLSKENYEFKANLLGEIMSFEKELQAVKYKIDNVLDKLNAHNEKMGDMNDNLRESIKDSTIRISAAAGIDIDKLLDKIRNEIDNVINDAINDGIIKHQNKMIKIFIIISGVLLILLLSILGLNALKVINLSTISDVASTAGKLL